MASLIIDIGWYIGGSGVTLVLVQYSPSKQVEILKCDCEVIVLPDIPDTSLSGISLRPKQSHYFPLVLA